MAETMKDFRMTSKPASECRVVPGWRKCPDCKDHWWNTTDKSAICTPCLRDASDKVKQSAASLLAIKRATPNQPIEAPHPAEEEMPVDDDPWFEALERRVGL